MILASDFSAATLLALLTAAMYLWAAVRRNLVSLRGLAKLFVPIR